MHNDPSHGITIIVGNDRFEPGTPLPMSHCTTPTFLRFQPYFIFILFDRKGDLMDLCHGTSLVCK